MMAARPRRRRLTWRRSRFDSYLSPRSVCSERTRRVQAPLCSEASGRRHLDYKKGPIQTSLASFGHNTNFPFIRDTLTMVRATLILSAVLTVAMMSWGALCAPTPAVLPHPSMEMMQDAQMLWRTVTHQNILPGTLHSVNPEVGVTARWHEFLRRDGRATLAYIVE